MTSAEVIGTPARWHEVHHAVMVKQDGHRQGLGSMPIATPATMALPTARMMVAGPCTSMERKA
jgi:hypothetical protein